MIFCYVDHIKNKNGKQVFNFSFDEDYDETSIRCNSKTILTTINELVNVDKKMIVAKCGNR